MVQKGKDTQEHPIFGWENGGFPMDFLLSIDRNAWHQSCDCPPSPRCCRWGRAKGTEHHACRRGGCFGQQPGHSEITNKHAASRGMEWNWNVGYDREISG